MAKTPEMPRVTPVLSLTVTQVVKDGSPKLSATLAAGAHALRAASDYNPATDDFCVSTKALINTLCQSAKNQGWM